MNDILGGGNPAGGIPGGMEIDPTTIENEKCESCGCEVWTNGIVLKKISALVNPTGKDQLGTIPVLVCIRCQSPHPSSAPILPPKE